MSHGDTIADSSVQLRGELTLYILGRNYRWKKRVMLQGFSVTTCQFSLVI